MMDPVIVGKNIRILRTLFKETQAQLADAIGVRPNAISNYEKGSLPDRDVLISIANHYSITQELLISDSLQGLSNYTISSDFSVWGSAIDSFFPIITPDATNNNIHLALGIEKHREFYQSYKTDALAFDLLSEAEEEYIQAAESVECKAVATGNLIALYFLLLSYVGGIYFFLSEKPAEYNFLLANDLINEKEDIEIDMISQEEKEEFKQSVLELYSYCQQDEITKMLRLLKRSKRLSALADYYISLEYFYSLYETDYSRVMNKAIGLEMLVANARLGNKYASDFLRFYKKNMFKNLE